MLATNFYEKSSSGTLSNAHADVFGAAAATPQSEYKAIFANYLHNKSYIMEDNHSPTPTTTPKPPVWLRHYRMAFILLHCTPKVVGRAACLSNIIPNSYGQTI
jgi:hypothetical protein